MIANSCASAGTHPNVLPMTIAHNKHATIVLELIEHFLRVISLRGTKRNMGKGLLSPIIAFPEVTRVVRFDSLEINRLSNSGTRELHTVCLASGTVSAVEPETGQLQAEIERMVHDTRQPELPRRTKPLLGLSRGMALAASMSSHFRGLVDRGLLRPLRAN